MLSGADRSRRRAPGRRLPVLETEYPSIPQWLTLLFCSYILIWYLQAGYRVSILAAVRIEFLVGMALAALAIAYDGFDWRVRRSALSTWIAFYFLCVVFSLVLSYAPAVSRGVFFDRIIKFGMMAVFIVAFVRSPRQLRYFLAAFMLACMKMSQEGVVGVVTGSMMWHNQGILRLHGSTPNYMHPNSFAGMVLGTIPFAYYLMPAVSRTIALVLLAQIGMAATVILYSGSRTAYVGVLLSVVYLALLSRRRLRFLVVLAVLLALAVPFIPEDYVERFSTISEDVDTNVAQDELNSKGLRLQVLRDAFDVFLRYPLGVGVGAFPTVRYDLFGRYQNTHSLYLEVLTNLGLQGVIAFAGMLFAMMVVLTRMVRSTRRQLASLEKAGLDDARGARHVADLRLLYATASAVRMFLFVRLALGLFGHDLYEIYWWFALGLTVSLDRLTAVAEQRTEELEASAATAEPSSSVRATAPAPGPSRLASPR